MESKKSNNQQSQPNKPNCQHLQYKFIVNNPDIQYNRQRESKNIIYFSWDYLLNQKTFFNQKQEKLCLYWSTLQYYFRVSQVQIQKKFLEVSFVQSNKPKMNLYQFCQKYHEEGQQNAQKRELALLLQKILKLQAKVATIFSQNIQKSQQIMKKVLDKQALIFKQIIEKVQSNKSIMLVFSIDTGSNLPYLKSVVLSELMIKLMKTNFKSFACKILRESKLPEFYSTSTYKQYQLAIMNFQIQMLQKINCAQDILNAPNCKLIEMDRQLYDINGNKIKVRTMFEYYHPGMFLLINEQEQIDQNISTNNKSLTASFKKLQNSINSKKIQVINSIGKLNPTKREFRDS